MPPNVIGILTEASPSVGHITFSGPTVSHDWHLLHLLVLQRREPVVCLHACIPHGLGSIVTDCGTNTNLRDGRGMTNVCGKETSPSNPSCGPSDLRMRGILSSESLLSTTVACEGPSVGGLGHQHVGRGVGRSRLVASRQRGTAQKTERQCKRGQLHLCNQAAFTQPCNGSGARDLAFASARPRTDVPLPPNFRGQHHQSSTTPISRQLGPSSGCAIASER